jgi:hypothetical protein
MKSLSNFYREDDDNMYGGYAEVVAISQHFECPVYVIRLDDPGLTMNESFMLVPSELYRIGETKNNSGKLMRLYYDPRQKHYEAIMEEQLSHKETVT